MFSQWSSWLALGAALIKPDLSCGLFKALARAETARRRSKPSQLWPPKTTSWAESPGCLMPKRGGTGNGAAAEDGEAADEAEPGVAFQDTKLGGAARLPDFQAGRVGDWAEAAVEAEPGVAAQDTELGETTRLPDAQAGWRRGTG